MSHHGENPFINLSALEQDKIRKEFSAEKTNFNLSDAINRAKQQFGATGKFPEEKLNESDEGQIAFGCTIHENKLIINFGEKPISWIGFTKDEAKNLAEYILKKIEEMPLSEKEKIEGAKTLADQSEVNQWCKKSED